MGQAMKLRALVAALVATFAVALAAASAASADGVAVDASPDPVEDVAYQVSVAGTASSDMRVVVALKPTGGRPCASNSEADDGERIISRDIETPSFNVVVNETTLEAGTYLLCAWLSPYPWTVPTAVAEKTITVRTPRSSASISVPGRVRAGKTLQVAVTAQTEVSRSLYVDVNLPGIPCGANQEANREMTTVFHGEYITGGPITRTDNVTAGTAPGLYTVCGYIQEYYGDAVPEATFSGSFTVISARCSAARAALERYAPLVPKLKRKVRRAPTKAAKRRRKAELRVAKRKLATAKLNIARHCQ